MTQWNFCPECSTNMNLVEGRPTCPEGHFTKWPTPVAATFAFVENRGEYLIIKRAEEPEKDKWDLPGGFLEYNETADDCILREIDEETGLKEVVIKRIFGTFFSDYGDVEKVLSIAYLAQSVSREIKLSSENSEYKWVKIDKMPQLAFDDMQTAHKLLVKEMV